MQAVKLTKQLNGFVSGEHACVISRPDRADEIGFCLRRHGFEVRDSVRILTPDEHGYIAFLGRKKLDDTVADNVALYGVGCLDIDGSRVQADYSATELRLNALSHQKTVSNRVYGVFDPSAEKTTQDLGYHHSKGRWPANTILVHKPSCEELDTEPDWDCEPGCPVPVMDAISGDLAPQGGQKKKDTTDSSWFGGGSLDSTFYGDLGGASRFFYQALSKKHLTEHLGRLIGSVDRVFWVGE